MASWLSLTDGVPHSATSARLSAMARSHATTMGLSGLVMSTVRDMGVFFGIVQSSLLWLSRAERT